MPHSPAFTGSFLIGSLIAAAVIIAAFFGNPAQAAYCEGVSHIKCYEGVDRSGRSPYSLRDAALIALHSATTQEERELATRALNDAFDPAMSDQHAKYCNQSGGGYTTFQRCMGSSNSVSAQDHSVVKLASATVGGFISLIVVAGIILYFVPYIVATSRKVEGTGLLLLVNLLFGWTVVGWFGCILWASLAQDGIQRELYRKLLREQQKAA